jgi:hypothetical protein
MRQKPLAHSEQFLRNIDRRVRFSPTFDIGRTVRPAILGTKTRESAQQRAGVVLVRARHKSLYLYLCFYLCLYLCMGGHVWTVVDMV